MKELERKFKLKFMPADAGDPIFIKQAYLLVKGSKHLRVRIIDDKEAFMTYKEVMSDIEKKEYEFPIPLDQALELYDNAEHKLVKKRYCGKFLNYHVDIDVYPGGMQVVEIEFEDYLIETPSYCGEEISGKEEFSNIQLAYLGKMKTF